MKGGTIRFPGFLISLAICFKDFRNFLNGVPIARSCRNAEELFDLAEITDRFHLPSIKAQNEFVLDCNDFEKPVIGRGEIEGQRREFGCLTFATTNPSMGGFEVRGLM
jgi:hypothetical protein